MIGLTLDERVVLNVQLDVNFKRKAVMDLVDTLHMDDRLLVKSFRLPQN